MSLIEDITNTKQYKSENMAASITPKILQIRKERIKQSLRDPDTVSHRQEYVKTIDKVSYVNDSKATTANATWFTFENIFSPVIWIAGGIDNGNDYSDLLPMVKKNVRTLICIGSSQQRLHQVFDGIIEHVINADGLSSAVQIASEQAQEHDIVLFSPACEANDMFRDYADRGEQFKMEVNKL